MAIQRWDPFGEMLSLREAMDRLFQQSMVPLLGRAMGSEGEVSMAMPMDVAEDEHEYTIRATMPGVRPEDVHVSVHGNVLTISGETRREEKQEQKNWLMREQAWGSFRRSITLPTNVDADQARATCENGVVTLTLPKAAEARPRRIPIGGASGRQTVEGTTLPAGTSSTSQTGTTSGGMGEGYTGQHPTQQPSSGQQANTEQGTRAA